MDVTLTVAGGNSKGKHLKLRSPQTIVGRGAGCDVRIPSASVSRRHCRLSFQDGYLTVEDLGSANGTYVNGSEVKKQAVRPGDRLEIGPLAFVVDYHLTSQAEKVLAAENEEPFALVDVETVEEVEDIPLVDIEAADVEAADVEPVDAEAVDAEAADAEAVEIVEVEAAGGGKATKKGNTGTAKPQKKAKKTSPEKKKQPEPAAAEEKAAAEPEASWHVSAGDGDIRDILSQLE